ncbi:MAG: phospholipid carrier-dependent glycosyltransferase [Chloroflexi bacterium]|nr:phospholipid carrier-dependent glycosyltransferase [Chloroflexota bacterium]
MTSVTDQTGRLKWWEAVLLLTGLLLFVVQAGFSSPRKSAAFDEEYHVAAGYAYLKTGDFRMSLSHPPLINALSALPLLFRDDVNLPTGHPSWSENDYFNFADVFLWQAQEDPQSVLEWARWPVIFLGAILTAAIFWWAREMAGIGAGWIAFILAVFDPNLIANSRLVTTDLGLTCFLFLTIWRLWHWLKRPSLTNLILTGLLAGLTMSAKFTGLLVWPMIIGVVVLWRLETYPEQNRRIGDWGLDRRNLQSLISNLLIMSLFAFLALWAVFRFDISPYPGTNIPLPASFYPYSLWDTFVGIEQQPKTSFLLGQTSARGWWYYFPVALLVKTSLPLLILTAVGTFTFIKQSGWCKASILWLPSLLFMLLAMSGRITIGYRHILPVVPFLIMLAAQIGRLEIRDWRLDRHNLQSLIPNLIIITLLAWHLTTTIQLFPHQEAFFNELARGPAFRGRVLVDSNIDWGQDLIALRELPLQDMYLGYFGTAVPEAYQLQYKPIPGFLRQTAGPEINTYNPYTPPPGWYALSLTSLQLGLLEQNIDMYAYFRDKTPIFRAGYSINVYQVKYPEEMPVDRAVVTGAAVSDLSPEELGVRDGRRLITKWTANEATHIIPFTEPFTLPEAFRSVKANYADVLTLIGYTLADSDPKPGEPLALTLFWERGSGNIPGPAPTKAGPLAVFVHLSGTDPAQIFAQFDGWDTAVSTLEPGDIISQQITLRPPPDMPADETFLRVGLYSPQSDQRFPLVNGTGDFVTIDYD